MSFSTEGLMKASIRLEKTPFPLPNSVLVLSIILSVIASSLQATAKLGAAPKPETVEISQGSSTGLIPGSVLVTEQKLKKKEGPWLLSAGLSYARALFENDDGTLQRGTNISIEGGYKFEHNYSLTLGAGYNNDLLDKSKSSPHDVKIVGSKAFEPKFGTANYGLKLTGTIPASKESIDDFSLQGGVNLTGTVSSKPGTVLWGYVNVEARLSAAQGFHKYDTTSAFKSNKKNTSNQGFKTTFTLQNLSLTVDLLHRYLWDYEGNQSERLGHNEELSYKFNKHFALTLGHDVDSVNGIPLTKEDGTSNLALINEDASVVYINLSLSI